MRHLQWSPRVIRMAKGSFRGHGYSPAEAAISRFSLWTVPVPNPVKRATLPMPTPFASSCRAQAIWACSAPGRPRRLRTMPALVVKRPSRLILALMALRPAFTRCRIMLRSNSEKAPVTWKSSLPVGVVVSRCGLRPRHQCQDLLAQAQEVVSLDGEARPLQRLNGDIEGRQLLW
jgi:hypothetical protein